jgi:subtilase family protein
MNIKFPAIRVGYAEPKEKQPKVAVMDNFRDADTELAHGEIVESVMLTHGGLQEQDIQRYHAESGPFISPQEVLQAPAEQLLESYAFFARGATASFLNMVSDNLEQVMAEQSEIKVVNQSQSLTPARIAEPFLQPVLEDQNFRGRLAQRLDLPADSAGPSVASKLLQLTEVMMEKDKGSQDARERYENVSRQAFESGIVNVVAAGNQGALATSLQKQGVKTSPKTFRSILVNDWVTVVGGATSDGKLSHITSPDAGAEVFALGENVPFTIEGQTLSASGTSLSAPLIASFAVQLSEQHPDFGPSQLEARMKG